MAKKKRKTKKPSSRRPFAREAVLRRVRRATCFIAFNEEKKAPKVIGSGVLVGAQRHVYTAKHVVEMCAKLSRDAKQRKVASSTILGFYEGAQMARSGNGWNADFHFRAIFFGNAVMDRFDGAVITLTPEQAKGLESLKLHPSAVGEGRYVGVCGFPYGMKVHEGKSTISSFCQGMVSAVVPYPGVEDKMLTHYLLQIPANPGNSGGPVFDPDTGAVVGVVSRGLVEKGFHTHLTIAEPSTRMLTTIKASLKQSAVAQED